MTPTPRASRSTSSAGRWRATRAVAGSTRPAVHAVRPAATEADWGAVGRMIETYRRSLGFSLDFQGVAAEVADPIGSYGPPAGAALLVVAGGGDVAGVAAIRPLAAAGDAELKRMYLAPAARGVGLGRVLACAAVDKAGRLGHRRLLLDSRASMRPACALYRSLGFTDVAPYCDNPFDDAVFLGLELR